MRQEMTDPREEELESRKQEVLTAVRRYRSQLISSQSSEENERVNEAGRGELETSK